MDAIDLKILKILKLNSRVSYQSIGKSIHLSTSAVVERIKKLEHSNIIQSYTAIFNNKAFNKQLTAMMFISLESPKYTEDFLNFIAKEKDVLECHYISGNYDIVIKILTQDTTTLAQLLTKIESQKGVVITNTNVVLKTIKNECTITPDF